MRPRLIDNPRVLLQSLGLTLLFASAFAAQAQNRIYAYSASTNHLVSFDASSPGTLLTDVALTLSGNPITVPLIGIDFRPATGELYGIVAADSSTGALAKIDITTGVVTLLNISTVIPLAGSGPPTPGYGVSFDAVSDSLRVVTNKSGFNFRVNPTTSATTVDTSLSYVAGDPHAGAAPGVVHLAYTNHVAGAAQGTAYGIDINTGSLVRIGSPGGSPNSAATGQLTTIGPLGVTTLETGGFDIAPGSNTAYAGLKASPTFSGGLFRIDLVTGAATLIGPTSAHGIAIAPVNKCLDIDGDGKLDALTDGIMLSRIMFGLTGSSVTNGMIGSPPPPRPTWTAIRTYLNNNCGMSLAP